MNNRKKRNIFLLIILILCISVGFAMLSTTLKINGDTIVKKNVWSIYWDNVGDIKKTNSVVVNTQASVDINNNTLVNFSVTLDKPGDFYEFQVDAVNAGTIDAMVDTVSTIINGDEEEELPSYIKYSVTYADNVKVNKYDLLEKADYSTDPITPTTERYKVRIEFSRDITNEEFAAIPANGLNYTFDVSIPYVQSDEHAKYKPGVFEIGTWDEIITAYNNGTPDNSLQKSMKRGSTREVELDLDHDGTSETTAHLRIANLSTPNECNGNNISQSACGFVLEFTDLLAQHYMNPEGMCENWGHSTINGRCTKGSWEYSDMRAFVNSTIYAEGTEREHNYQNEGIYASLPDDLKSKIIDTTVISGYGQDDDHNFITTDKLYLLDLPEIYGSSFTDQYSTTKDCERQLDYYSIKGITVTNFDEAGKADFTGEVHWQPLRTPYRYYASNFYSQIGGYDIAFSDANAADATGYVAPAFRIAKAGN